MRKILDVYQYKLTISELVEQFQGIQVIRTQEWQGVLTPLPPMEYTVRPGDKLMIETDSPIAGIGQVVGACINGSLEVFWPQSFLEDCEGNYDTPETS